MKRKHLYLMSVQTGRLRLTPYARQRYSQRFAAIGMVIEDIHTPEDLVLALVLENGSSEWVNEIWEIKDNLNDSFAYQLLRVQYKNAKKELKRINALLDRKLHLVYNAALPEERISDDGNVAEH